MENYNYLFQLAGPIDKPIEIYCPVLFRKETVWFVPVPYSDPPSFCFNRCENSPNSSACQDCRHRAEKKFAQVYPDLCNLQAPR